MKQFRTHTIIIAFCLTAGFLSCSESERRGGLAGLTSTVIINLGLPDEHAAAGLSIADRIRRFFTRDALAQTAPATFSTVRVRVTGADFGLIEKDFAPYGALSVDVPSGSLRRFEVIATVAPGDLSAAASFSGTAEANLPAGGIVNVPVLMKLNETKIIAPDNGNARISMKDAMHGGWRVNSTFQQPMDIDFDSRGRIYVVDQNSYYVWRLENIADTNPVRISQIDWLYIVAVDRYRDRIFYSDEGSIWENNLSGTNESAAKNLISGSTSITSIYGMDAAPDGMLYIVGQVNIVTTQYTAIIRYDPSANSGNGAIVGTSVAITAITSRLSSPGDIQVKWPYAYVANAGGAAGYKILKVLISDGAFSLAGSYGSQAAGSPTTPAGSFYGPIQFTGLSNNGLFIMDDMAGYARLVFIEDSLVSGWDTVGGTQGGGVDQFLFF